MPWSVLSGASASLASRDSGDPRDMPYLPLREREAHVRARPPEVVIQRRKARGFRTHGLPEPTFGREDDRREDRAARRGRIDALRGLQHQDRLVVRTGA